VQAQYRLPLDRLGTISRRISQAGTAG